ncbi:MAG: mannose-1-phosphate guanylyltransferase/mannose-6-phosphate isomerase [Rhodovibrionaceae bacterium]
MNKIVGRQELPLREEQRQPEVHPVILCGGSGKRLWPVSRQDCPKQFQRLSSDKSLLQETVLRAQHALGLGAPIILCNAEHRYMVRDHLEEIGVEPAAVVCEPLPRNTAPALAAAASLLHERNPAALMLAMPADHHIGDAQAFAATFGKARAAAEAGMLVTFGIRPDRPETGYGYIEQGEALGELAEASRVARFVEKPARHEAEQLLAEGRYLWNSGIFLLPVDAFLEELQHYAPECRTACAKALAEAIVEGDTLRLDAEAFAEAPDVSVDVAVMERTGRAAVVPAEMGWSDIGTWPALRDLRAGDSDGNVLDGNTVTQDVSNCYIKANGRLIAAVGLKDLVIVDTEDAVLISSAEQTVSMDRLVGRLRKDGHRAADQHALVQRPWGHYQTVESGERFQVKHILVKPGEKLSLQMHHHRAEHWIVVSGTGRITRDEETMLLHENQSIHIPLGASHSLENPGKIPLHLIEVQVGAYLGEDDIVRFEDRYGRS